MFQNEHISIRYFLHSYDYTILQIIEILHICRLPFKNSYFIDIKSFQYNTEYEISSHYKSKKPTSSYTLPNSRSMEIKYHISISEIPDSNYSPRLADDRVGHFLTIYQDYSDVLTETPYIRYINRLSEYEINQTNQYHTII